MNVQIFAVNQQNDTFEGSFIKKSKLIILSQSITLEVNYIRSKKLQLRFTEVFWYLCWQRRYFVFIRVPFLSKGIAYYLENPTVPRRSLIDVVRATDVDRDLRRSPVTHFQLVRWREHNGKLLIDTNDLFNRSTLINNNYVINRPRESLLVRFTTVHV